MIKSFRLEENDYTYTVTVNMYIRSSVTGALQVMLKGHSYTVTSVALSHNSKLVVSGSADNSVRIWIREMRTLKWMLEDHDSFRLTR